MAFFGAMISSISTAMLGSKDLDAESETPRDYQ